MTVRTGAGREIVMDRRLAERLGLLPRERRGRTAGREAEAAFRGAMEDAIGGALQGRQGRDILRDLQAEAMRTGSGIVARGITDELNRQLRGGFGAGLREVFADLPKALNKNIAGLNLSAKSLLNAALAGEGVVSLLGMRGRKKQTRSLLGGLAGLAIGSLIPGGNLLTDFAIGAGIGGFFAGGETRRWGARSCRGDRSRRGALMACLIA